MFVLVGEIFGFGADMFFFAVANNTPQFPKRSASIICQWVMAV